MQKFIGYALITLSIVLIMSFLKGISNFINNIINILNLIIGKLSSFEAGEVIGALVIHLLHIFLIVVTMKYGKKLIK